MERENYLKNTTNQFPRTEQLNSTHFSKANKSHIFFAK